MFGTIGPIIIAADKLPDFLVARKVKVPIL